MGCSSGESCINDIVVVPAQHAWPEYLRCHAYICQPGRSFKTVPHIAFYAEGEIKPVVPEICEVFEHIELASGAHGGSLGKLVDALLDDPASLKETGVAYKIMLLSSPEDSATLKLDKPIVNDLRSTTGRLIAFTRNQRYVSWQELRTANTTADLIRKRTGS